MSTMWKHNQFVNKTFTTFPFYSVGYQENKGIQEGISVTHRYISHNRLTRV